MKMLIEKIKKKINSLINYIIEKFVDDNIKELLISLYNYRENPKEIVNFILLLPFTILFLILNLVFFFFFLFNYFFVFLYFYLKIKILKKENKKIIKFKKRFKFLKNYYAVIIEKTIITFPRKKAYLLFYVIMKKIINKNEKFIEKDLIIDWIKAISNRYILSTIIGLPYIVLYCNNIFVKTIKNSIDLNYESNMAWVNTVILNLYKNLTPSYSKLVEKLKIIITKKRITFNSKKEIIKALKNKREFIKSFNKLKNELIYGLVKNKEEENIYSKYHPTVILNTNENKLIYSNETTKKNLKVWLFMKDIEEKNKEKYLEKEIKNNFKHGGSIKKVEAYYTDPIETEKNNIIIKDPFGNVFLEKNIKNENINNITANFTINLEKEVIKTKKLKIDEKGNEKYVLTKNEISQNFITWVKENQGKIDNESFEALMEINYFWKVNEVIIENLSLEEKIELSKILNIGVDEFKNPKEVNFKIFISFISKDIKN